MGRLAPLLLLTVVAVVMTLLPTASAQMPMHHYAYPRAIEQGCALCRGTGNCSKAVDNTTAGVYCGDLVTTFQPCCCQYRNECMTTIFSEHCECLTDAEVEQFMSARFTVFCIFTVLFWLVLIWDRMCGRPYKVMNSNRHHALAMSPSVARLVDGAPPREAAGDQELLEVDHRDRNESDDDDNAAIEAALNAQADESSSSAARRDQDVVASQSDPHDDLDDVVLNMQDDPGSDHDEHSPRRQAGTAGSIQSV